MKRMAAILLLLLCSCQPRADKNPDGTDADSVEATTDAVMPDTQTEETDTRAGRTNTPGAAPRTEAVADGQGLTLTFTTDARGTVHLTGDLCRRLERDQWLRVEPKSGAAVDQVLTMQWPDSSRTEVLAFNKNNHYLTTANPVADFKAIYRAPNAQRGVILKFKKGGRFLPVQRTNTVKGVCTSPHPDVVVDGD